MWYAIDLFTNAVYGPYDSSTEAWMNNKGKAVSVEWSRRKKRVTQ
jgi:hypothetical protein